MSFPSSSLPALAAALGTSPQADALALLERLLDSLPIGFSICDASDDFRLVYANRAWDDWISPELQPVVGKRLLEVVQTDGAVAEVMHQVRASNEAQHLRGFRVGGLRRRTADGGETLWDWEVYPVSDRAGDVSHLIVCAMDVAESHSDPAAAQPQAHVERLREEASGVLRIFGLPTHTGGAVPGTGEALSEREREVAELVALGLRNSDIATRLFVSRATVASHIAAILMKLQFRSRTQIAAWVVAERLRGELG
jgi:DNA-binding CsgD family transcriptional regulator